MTKPKMVRCPGSGDKRYGPNGQWGTVDCSQCLATQLPIKTTTTADGKKEFSVPEHTRRANPIRRKGASVASPTRRDTRRDSGRRR